MTETARLYMTPEEIKSNYLQAKDRKEQIKVLADLNATSRQRIREVLEEQGVDLNHYVESRKAWWTADEDALLRDLWAQGCTIKEIADVMCRTEKSVANRRHRLHLTKDGQAVSEAPAEAEEKIPRDVRNDTEGAEARNDSKEEPVVMEVTEESVIPPIGITWGTPVAVAEEEPAEAEEETPRDARNDAEEAKPKAPAGRPVLSAEGMLRLVFRAVRTQLNSYMEDGDDKEPTLADLLSSVGLLALRYFDEGGKNND